MRRPLGFASFSTGFLLAFFAAQSAGAQSFVSSQRPRAIVTQAIDEDKRVILHGNTRPEANMKNDRGRVRDDFRLEHLLLQLKRSKETETALQNFLTELQTSGSPNFQKWISAEEFGERFGVAPQDLDKVTDWLEHHHLQVNVVYPSGMVVDFSGTAAEVRRAFGVDIHVFHVGREDHFANTNDPGVPAALAPIVEGIVSIHNFSPHALHLMRRPSANFTFSGSNGQTYALVPADLATIYNLNPLFAAGYAGQGQTIVLIEDTDVFSASDWSTFRSALGLSSYTTASFQAVHPAPAKGPNNCAAPGVIAPNDAEAILDAEWASAAAPGAAIEMAACADSTTTFGGLIAMQNLLNAKNPPPALMSVSYGQCETVNGAAANAAYNSAYQLAVAEGVSVFVAAGDSGAAGCDNSATAATHGIAVNAFASTPYNVAVGGTDFSDTINGTNSTYWGTTNSSTFGSALSYIPEIPWNNSCAGALLSQYEGFNVPYGQDSLCNDGFVGSFLQTTVAGGGGPSACATGTPSTSSVVSGTCQGWPKPSWQSVFGNPNDGVRDTPDVSLFAADGLWSHYYVFCWSDTTNGGAACTGDPSGWSGAGGTSFASPIMAGIQALINQRTGSRQGNPNPAYYQLAAAEYGAGGNSSCNSTEGNAISSACVFNDVTQGDMAVNCVGNFNCFLDGTSNGVLSTDNHSYQPAYGTTAGWDFATGIGTINALNLVNNWPGSSAIPSFGLSASPNSVTLTQGNNGTTTITVLPQNGFSGSVTLTASGLPTGVTASFSPATTTGTSTLTLKASGTAATGTANVAITGTSGTLTSVVSVSLAVNALPPPNFALSASPTSLTFPQGASGSSTITVTPQNGFNSSVSLAASGLPTGVTASFSPTSTPSTSAPSTSTLTLTASGTATTGTATVTISGTSGTLTNSTTLSLTIRVMPTLPSVWTDGDVGTVGVAGASSYGNDVFTVAGAGSGTFSTSSDSFHFVYQPLSGDGSIVARLTNSQGGGAQQAGVMIRETLDPAANHVFLFNYSSAVWMTARTTTGSSSSYQSFAGASLPTWIKLARAGNVFTVSGSSDGVNWAQFATQTVTMAQNVYIGMAVSNRDTSSLATAAFDSISVNSATASAPIITAVSATTGSVGSQVVISGSGFGATQNGSVVRLKGATTTINSWSATSITITIPSAATSGPLLVSVAPNMNDSNAIPFTVTSQPLPPSWLDQDVGSVGLAGAASYANGTFTVSGAGQGTFLTTSDSFHFVYQPLSGDGTVIARVVNLTGSTSSAQAGVMIRETLNPTANHVYLFDYSSAIWMTERTTAGASSSYQSFSSTTLPYWIKLTRTGNAFNMYGSADGVTWIQLGTSQTITMAQSVYVGLAVSSRSTSSLVTATFDNVSLSAPVAPPPSFTLSASPSSLTLVQGTSGTSTIAIAPQNGFNGSVTFSAPGLPNGGLSASFSPASSTSASTVTLTASSTATTGTFNVTVTGTSGTLSTSTSISVTVNAAVLPNFTISASPDAVTVVQGTSGTSTISVTPQNGFNGTVTFSASGLPSGVTPSFSPGSSTSGSTLTLTANTTATTGTFTVTITGNSGSLSNSTPLSLTVNVAPPSTAVPSQWTDADLGSTGMTGNATYTNGTFTVAGAGQGTFFASSDSFNFVYQPLSGDGAIVARVVTVQGSGTQQVGIMIRETLNPTANHVYLFDYSSAIWMTERTSTGASSSYQSFSSGTLPYWIKLTRTGNVFNMYGASDGVNWVQLGTSQTITMAQNVYVGLAVSSRSTSSLATATFDSVSVNSATAPAPVITAVSATTGSIGSQVVISGSGFGTSQGNSVVLLNSAPVTINSWSNTAIITNIPAGATSGPLLVSVAPSMNDSNALPFTVTSQPLPASWLDQDVGSVGLTGNATYANGAFTVAGAGQGTFFATSDGLHFVYQPLSGNGTIIARVVTAQGSSPQAGIMIRETLNATANHVYLFDYASTIWATERTATGASSSYLSFSGATLPYWIKLTRTGNVFNMYGSTDGVSWTQLGTSQTITMAQNVYVGLAVSSRSTSSLATATFDNVAITNP